MLRLFALVAALLLPVVPAAAAEPPPEPEVGTTIVARRNVTATLHDVRRELRKGLRLHREEVIETSANGHAEVELDDSTKLVMGPGAKLALTEYVVGSADRPAVVSLRFLTGAFRFLTGSNDSRAYNLETPVATLGIRGTVLDVFVGDDGATLVLLHSGAVQVCGRSNSTCRLHNTLGMIMRTDLAGLVSEPLKWTGNLMSGVLVATAFPFIGRKLVVDPIRRLTRARLLAPGFVEPTKRAGRAIRQGAQGAGRAARRIGRSIRNVSPF